jgi:pimeloyl-ACP methyl ester carboxylesterase
MVALICGGALFERITRSRDLREHSAAGRFADLGGRRLHLLERGDSGPSVVILTGISDAAVYWTKVMDLLASSTRAIVYDRPGYGWSDPSPIPPTASAMAEDLLAMVMAAGIPRPCVLVAHSGTGFAARVAARRYPDLVAGLVLVDTLEEGLLEPGAPPEVADSLKKARQMLSAMAALSTIGVPRLLSAAGAIPAAATARLPPGAREVFLTLGMHGPALSAGRDELALLNESARQAREAGLLRDLPLVVISAARFDNIGQKLPTETQARLEKADAESRQRLAALSSRAYVLVAERSGHAVHLDQPDIIAAGVGKILELGASPAPARRQTGLP